MSFNSEKIILSYDFKNICPGDGDGTIKIGFCGECTENIGSISVSWSKDGNVLDDYTPICTLSADELENGYAIDKEMKIPYGADGI